jgi:hypothetical protein
MKHIQRKYTNMKVTAVKINISELLVGDAVESARRVRTFRCSLLPSSPVKLEEF